MDLITQTEFEKIKAAEAEQAHLESLKINKVIASRDITYILELYGAYNRAGLDNVGHAPVAMGFKTLVAQSKTKSMCSEDDAIIIDSILLRLANSRDAEKKAMSNIIKYYYVGIDDAEVCKPVPCKSLRMIGERLGYGETKTAKLKEAAENYICGSLDALNRVLDCEFHLGYNTCNK